MWTEISLIEILIWSRQNTSTHFWQTDCFKKVVSVRRRILLLVRAPHQYPSWAVIIFQWDQYQQKQLQRWSYPILSFIHGNTDYYIGEEICPSSKSELGAKIGLQTTHLSFWTKALLLNYIVLHYRKRGGGNKSKGEKGTAEVKDSTKCESFSEADSDNRW